MLYTKNKDLTSSNIVCQITFTANDKASKKVPAKKVVLSPKREVQALREVKPQPKRVITVAQHQRVIKANPNKVEDWELSTSPIVIGEEVDKCKRKVFNAVDEFFNMNDLTDTIELLNSLANTVHTNTNDLFTLRELTKLLCVLDSSNTQHNKILDKLKTFRN